MKIDISYFICTSPIFITPDKILSFIIIIIGYFFMNVTRFNKILSPRIQFRAINKLMIINFTFYAF